MILEHYTNATPEEHAALTLAGFVGPDATGDYEHPTRGEILANNIGTAERTGARWLARPAIRSPAARRRAKFHDAREALLWLIDRTT